MEDAVTSTPYRVGGAPRNQFLAERGEKKEWEKNLGSRENGENSIQCQ